MFFSYYFILTKKLFTRSDSRAGFVVFLDGKTTEFFCSSLVKRMSSSARPYELTSFAEIFIQWICEIFGLVNLPNDVTKRLI